METQKHSGLGIASCALSMVSGFLMAVLVVVAAVIESSTPGGMDEESVTAVVIGLGMFGLLGAAILAFCLGIAGVFQKERKKIFAILGLIFSAVSFLGLSLLILIGLLMG